MRVKVRASQMGEGGELFTSEGRREGGGVPQREGGRAVEYLREGSYHQVAVTQSQR